MHPQAALKARGRGWGNVTTATAREQKSRTFGVDYHLTLDTSLSGDRIYTTMYIPDTCSHMDSHLQG
jgi:hypothetical protein